jgi:hypothetical protein
VRLYFEYFHRLMLPGLLKSPRAGTGPTAMSPTNSRAHHDS